MGVPVVSPSKTPERISTLSASDRGVSIEERPGLRLAISLTKSSSDKGMPEGQPSITVPMPFPCDSPKVVILNAFPKEFPATLIASRYIAFMPLWQGPYNYLLYFFRVLPVSIHSVVTGAFINRHSLMENPIDFFKGVGP